MGLLKDKLIHIVILVFLFIPTTVFAKHDEWAVNNGYEFEYRLNKKITFSLGVEHRARDDFKRFYYYHFQPEFTYEISKYLDFGLGYRYIKQKKIGTGEDIWSDEHRLLFDPKLKWEFAGLKFSNLLRFEYRYFDLVMDKWRYRNKLKVSKKAKIRSFEFTPFVADEVFYDLREDRGTQNRFDLGFEKEISKNVQSTLFYRLQSERTGNDWAEMHIIGIKFEVFLGGGRK